MPIKKYLEQSSISPETARAMTDAFIEVCRILESKKIERYSTQAIAQKVAALASVGEHDSKRIVHDVIKAMGVGEGRENV